MENKNTNRLVDRTLAALRKKYVFVGATHVRAWHMWLLLGVVAGGLGTVLLVANRSGQLEPSAARDGIAVLSPNGGEVWQAGTSQNIQWRGGKKDDTVFLSLLPESSSPPALHEGSPGSGGGIAIAQVSNTGLSSWAIPSGFAPGQYRVSVCLAKKNAKASDKRSCDVSDAPLSIVVPTNTTNTNIRVSLASSQPPSTIAPHSAIVPFTNIVISVPAGVSLSRITVERKGLASDAAFKEILLINNNGGFGGIIGIGTIDSTTHRAIVQVRDELRGRLDSVTNVTIAGVMADDESQNQGNTVLLSVASADFIGTISEQLMNVTPTTPLAGNLMTINNSLQIGSVSITHPSSQQLQFTASSIEDIKLNAVILSSYAGSSVSVNNTNYQCDSLSNAYERCVFGGGILISRGSSATASFSGSTDALLDFHDVNVYGAQYSYRIMPVAPKITVGSQTPYISVIPFSGAGKLYSGRPTLLQFSVTAQNGPIGIAKFTFHVATSSAVAQPGMIDNVNLYAYTDSGFSMIAGGGVSNDGSVAASGVKMNQWASSASEIEIYPQAAGGAQTLVYIPAGTTMYFVLRGDATVSGSTYSVTTQMLGDGAPANSTTFAGVNADPNNNFIWTLDNTLFKNGYGVQGLPANGFSQILSQ